MPQYGNILGAVGRTPLIRLSRIAAGIPSPIYAKAEFLAWMQENGFWETRPQSTMSVGESEDGHSGKTMEERLCNLKRAPFTMANLRIRARGR